MSLLEVVKEMKIYVSLEKYICRCKPLKVCLLIVEAALFVLYANKIICTKNMALIIGGTVFHWIFKKLCDEKMVCDEDRKTLSKLAVL